MNIEKSRNYILGFILILFFFINTYQITTQHWSGILDQDVVITYNSLLLASGYDQEYRGHPAFITFLIHSFIFKIVSFFQDHYAVNIDLIMNSAKINETFQFYFNVARVTNYFINIICFFVFYKLLILLKIKKELTFLICLIFLFSQWYFMSFFALRSEILNLLFFIVSMIFSLSQKRNLITNYFIAGIFLALAMLTKIQIIFFIPFLVLLIPFNFLEKKDYEINFPRSKIINNYFLLSLVLGIIIYVIFQIFIQEYPRFERNKYLDLFFFLFSFFCITFYYLIINNFNFTNIKKNLVLLSSTLNGYVFCLAMLIVIDKANIFPINDYIFLRLTNPIHYLTEFTLTFAEGSINANFLLTSSFDIFTSYNYSFVELLILLIILFLVIKKNINKDNNFVKFIIVLFVIFLINVTVNSYRPVQFYHTYYAFCYLVLVGLCLNNLSLSLSKYFTYLIFILFLFNNFYVFNYKGGFGYKTILSRPNAILSICKEFNYGEKAENYFTVSYLQYWHHKFDDIVIKKLCNEIT